MLEEIYYLSHYSASLRLAEQIINGEKDQEFVNATFFIGACQQYYLLDYLFSSL
ncbi:MAG: hypothetical protein ACYCSO_01860 [Cuniculiplasma sp.]